MAKTLGIIGGMGPLATAHLFQKIIACTRADRDQEHIRIFIDNNTGVPDRTAALLAGGEDPRPQLIDSARKLEAMGADFLINENWLLNASVWNIDIDTEARLYVNDARVDKIDVEIDPWVYMVGVGYRF